MTYDFTTVTNRLLQGARKWIAMQELKADVTEDIIPLSVADMEFTPPAEIKEGLQDYLDNSILGYHTPQASYLEAVCAWMLARHNWRVAPTEIVLAPNVVSAIKTAIYTLSEAGDEVLYFSPHYLPFKTSIEVTGRQCVPVPLIGAFGQYEIDWSRLEAAMKKARARVFIHCSPHNPTGRVWTEAEQRQLAELCLKHDVAMISDEIWQDFAFRREHINIDKVAPKGLALITCTSASKTFNLAGLQIANIIIKDAALRNRFQEITLKHGVIAGNTLGLLATEIAYRQAGDWQVAVSELIRTNQQMVVDFFKAHDLGIDAYLPEGTYVQWLDFSRTGLSEVAIKQKLLAADFFSQDQLRFGLEAGQYQRINVALPTLALKAALTRLASELEA